MRHNGWHLWMEPEQGETPELVYLALGISAVRLAEPDEDAAADGDGSDVARTVAASIRSDDDGMHLIVCGDRFAGLRLSRVSGQTDEYELDIDLYEGDSQVLLDLSAAMIRVLTILAKAGRL